LLLEVVYITINEPRYIVVAVLSWNLPAETGENYKKKTFTVPDGSRTNYLQYMCLDRFHHASPFDEIIYVAGSRARDVLASEF
jgi:hypothetical protein